MKPNFALKLSHDGVEILQRAAAGWIVTGSTRFDIPDLDGTLRQLRAQAEALAPEGLRTKLIIPGSEVRYATVVAPGPTDEARRLQIEAEIEGLTPYALHELSYDYVVEGDHALVAICAREILEEAEGFAQNHGFNPVAFVAMPASGVFSGEPFFGETSCARAFLSRNTSVERDHEAVRIAAPTKRPAEPAAPPARPADPSRAAAVAPVAAGVAARLAGQASGAGKAGAVPAAEAPDAFSKVGNLVRRMGTRIRREQAQAAAAPVSRAGPEIARTTPAGPAKTGAPSPTEGAAKPSAPSAEAKPPAMKADDAKPGDGKPAGETPAEAKPLGTKPAETKPAEAKSTEAKPAESRPTAPPPVAGKPPAPADAPASVAFSSRRAAPPVSSVSAPPAADRSATDAKRPAIVSEGPEARSGKQGPGGRIAMMPPKPEGDGPGRMTRLYRRSRRAAKSALVGVGLMQAGQGGGKRRGEGKRRNKELPKPLVPASAPPENEREKASEAAAMTIFGARNAQRIETGFARRGLMLTGALLLLLAAVAIWAVYFTGESSRQAELAQAPQGQTATLPPIDAPAQAPVPGDAAEEIAAPAPLAPPDEPDEAAITEDATEAPGDALAADEAPAQTTDPDALLEELVQEALTEALPVDLLGQAGEETTLPGDEAQTQEQTPGVPATAGETALDGAESPQVIPETVETDQRLALPPVLERPQLAEVAPVSPPPPPPFGAEFTLGPDGLVEATPEGALTPSGVTVFAGTPSAVPPARPAGLAPSPAAAEPEAGAPQAEPEAQLQAPAQDVATAEAVAEALQEAATLPDDTPGADPVLAGVRPLPRSPLVAQQAATAQPAAEPAQAEPTTGASPEGPGEPAEATNPDDDSAAAAPSPGGVLLDGLRPQRRPTDLVPPTETAEAAAEEPEAPEVVAVSLRPTARPDALSARVQESLAAARSPAPAAAAPAAAAAAPAAPAPAAPAASAAPNIPTTASVAQQATQARAINLRRVNLIGVFGTPNDRRALVRLSNGQVVRVQVGDRLDGGQVSAIGDNELRYVKNGRNEVLRIGSSG